MEADVVAPKEGEEGEEECGQGQNADNAIVYKV